jgi:uncharacterized protein YukE
MTVDPADVVSMGKAFGARADAVGALRERLSRQLGRATWTGPGASRFRFEAAQIDRRLAQDADDLRRLMGSLQRLADALEQELRALRRIEERVRSWLALNRTVPPPWPPGSLPPPGDPRWREVERAFVSAGIPLDATPASAGPTPAGGDWKATLSPAEAWIIQKESNFDPTAVNASSGAFGLWQGLGATLDTYANRFGFDRHTTDPNQQLTMFRAYIKDRYGTAENAKAFWERNGWY